MDLELEVLLAAVVQPVELEVLLAAVVQPVKLEVLLVVVVHELGEEEEPRLLHWLHQYV